MLTNEIGLEDKGIFDPYMSGYPYNLSEINFTNLFIWRHLNELRYEIIHGFLCVSGTYYGKPFVFSPLSIGAYDPNKLSDTIDTLNDRFKEGNHSLLIKNIPTHMMDLFKEAKPDTLTFKRDEDNDDYIYLSSDLIQLKGRKYHGKKNHLNYFIRHTPHQYVPLTHDLVDACLSLTRRIKPGDYTPVQSDLLDSEEVAIEEALTNIDALGFVGGAILINDQVEAFTIGEKLNKKTMVIHFEKANREYRGLYQAINQMFCKVECEDVKYINREEDMGFEYLRKAKKSYHPVKMMEKYDVTIR